MYPRVSDLVRDFLGFELPFPIYSFGLMVAVALLTAAALAKREFDRMHAAGLLPSVRMKVRDAKGRERVEPVSPSALIWTLMLMAAVLGIVGSKLFYFFEEWDRFVANPVGVAFSPDGLTFYGGLICAGVAIAYYVRRKGLPLGRVADAIAPTLILGYGIGRIGCYLAGDGDWGRCSDLADKPGWLPAFLWSERFPRSILDTDAVTFNVTRRLDPTCVPGVEGVYPTMLWEFAAGVLLFAGLWAVRKHPFRAGWLFSLYLVFTGVERFLVEFVRVNPDVTGDLSQAQLISVVLCVAGLVGLALTTRRAAPPATAPPAAGAAVGVKAAA
jgi:phosphatidylglycerol:prolipoprotein diacylglycerol transferase